MKFQPIFLRTHLKNGFDLVFSSIRTLAKALEAAPPAFLRHADLPEVVIAIQVTKDEGRRRRKDLRYIFEMSSNVLQPQRFRFLPTDCAFSMQTRRDM